MGEDVSSVRFSRDGTLLLTRCMDGTMKLFDVRNTKAALREVSGLETNNAHTAAVFSPDEGLVVTAVNASREARARANALVRADGGNAMRDCARTRGRTSFCAGRHLLTVPSATPPLLPRPRPWPPPRRFASLTSSPPPLRALSHPTNHTTHPHFQGASGALAFYETSTFKLVRRLGVSSGSAVALQWHPRLNQIFIGAGGAKEGAPRILYDPEYSHRGAIQAVGRAPRLKDPADLMIQPVRTWELTHGAHPPHSRGYPRRVHPLGWLARVSSSCGCATRVLTEECLGSAAAKGDGRAHLQACVQVDCRG